MGLTVSADEVWVLRPVWVIWQHMAFATLASIPALAIAAGFIPQPANRVVLVFVCVSFLWIQYRLARTRLTLTNIGIDVADVGVRRFLVWAELSRFELTTVPRFPLGLIGSAETYRAVTRDGELVVLWGACLLRRQNRDSAVEHLAALAATHRVQMPRGRPTAFLEATLRTNRG